MSESILNLKSKILNLPSSPGVYVYKDKSGKIIYIGKAKNLKTRVKQYFSGHDERPQIPYLMKELFDIDYTVVENELESLYLERTLIQKHTPKYNILLRDDKSYTFIAFDYSTQIPQILLTRRIADNKFEKRSFRDEKNIKYPISNIKTADYYGPYTAAYKVREVLKTIRYIFPYCTNQKVSNKPCFYYHLHRCPGVCIGTMNLDEYKLHLEKIKLFLKGDFKTVKKDIEKEMKIASSKKLFEKAARLRNQLRGLLMVEQKQSVIIPKKVNWDLIGLFSQDENTCINLFKVRGGKLIDKENFVYRTTEINAPTDTYGKNEILQKFLEDYYIETSDRPDKIYVKDNPEYKPLIEQLLKNRFHKKTSIIKATQKEPLRLLNMAEQNAGEYLKQSLSQKAGEIDKINSALNQLKEVLKLPQVPKRIECYDISNTQGTNPVGSMVVFVDGKPLKSQYRKFKIRGQQTPDDFAMMREMLSRRLSRITNQESGIMEKDKWPLPDLIVIDGGKGQLSVAVSIIHNSKFIIPVVGLAKRIEEIFLPNNPNPIILGHDQPALQLLQRLRDEAHRFGITFHRNLRSKQAVKSALDDISGIGPKTKKLLKEKFGTVATIKLASFEELEKVVGKKLANTIKLKL
jgi:excinuclease ABC subunit C